MDPKLLGLILQGDNRIAREITDLKNTMSDAGLTESGAIVQTAAGESIVVNDTSGDDLKGLRVFGKSEQTTYSGKNLFNKDNATYVSHISYSSNVYVKNGDERTRLYYLPIEPNTDYYVSKTIGANLRVCVSSEVPAEDVKVSTINSNTSSSECVIASGTTGKYLGLYLLWSAELDAGMTYESVLDTVIVAKSNSAVLYEPYTGGIPSPNPQYPQSIISAGDDGDVEVGVYGGNLLDLTKLIKLNKNDSCTYGGVTFTNVNNDYITVVGTATNYTSVSYYLDLPNGVYVLSGCDYSKNLLLRARIMKNGTRFDYGYGDPFEITDDVTSIQIMIQADTGWTVDTVIKPMLNKGTTPLPYEPYRKQSLPISTPNGLPGIKVTDAFLATYTDSEGNMWCADEIDFERGVYVKRIWKGGPIKTIVMTTGEDGGRCYMYNKPFGVKFATGGTKALSTIASWSPWGNGEDGTFALSETGIYYKDSTKTLDEVNTMFAEIGTNFEVLGVLNEPIETPLTNAELNAYKALHTNCPVTTILNDSGAHMELTYNADAKNYIDNKFTELTNAILSMGGNV